MLAEQHIAQCEQIGVTGDSLQTCSIAHQLLRCGISRMCLPMLQCQKSLSVADGSACTVGVCCDALIKHPLCFLHNKTNSPAAALEIVSSGDSLASHWLSLPLHHSVYEGLKSDMENSEQQRLCFVSAS